MNTEKTIKENLATLYSASEGVDEEIRRVIQENFEGEAGPLYKMLAYFLGFLDLQFKPENEEKSGKRFRPALCLFIADAYGVREKALPAAVARELFHNFTLIHDDVEDHDEFRRGRPTVWKTWGVNHAINSGDVLSLIASDMCVRAGFSAGSEKVSHTLLSAFKEVGEGQYLDFELSGSALESDLVSRQKYMNMIAKKSGALIGVSSQSAGIIAGRSEDECEALLQYGRSLGAAYQLADDYRSVWSTKEATGKDTHSDIREHKRTLPFFVALEELMGEARSRLISLYDLPRQLNEKEIAEVLAMINGTHAQSVVKEHIQKNAEQARSQISKLPLPDKASSTLGGIVDELVIDAL